VRLSNCRHSINLPLWRDARVKNLPIDANYASSKDKDVLTTTLYLQPGTYHLRFIVDGDMILSKNLPTAVDFTNSLVNYIEVVPIETTATAGAQTLMPADLQTQSNTLPVVDLHSTHPAQLIHEAAAAQLQQESNTPKLPPTPAIAPVQAGTPVPPTSETPAQHAEARRVAAAAAHHHQVRYTTSIPAFLKDSDAHETSQEFRRSQALSESLPGPPSLPMFLNKSILNGSMPMKDDASVLILPNHTVLNHLATTSIRSGVLATSGTTRYKRKVCPRRAHWTH
jgi:5'-AMP-activated protein kinase beta subunit, interaction domain/Glycogen recognition site of AMP-activated protein kinase